MGSQVEKTESDVEKIKSEVEKIERQIEKIESELAKMIENKGRGQEKSILVTRWA